MAQSQITIYKMARWPHSDYCNIDPNATEELAQLLECIRTGENLIYKTHHFDPATTAVIDGLVIRHSDILRCGDYFRSKNNDIDIIIITFSADRLLSIISNMMPTDSNVDEILILDYLFSSAITFWSHLFINNNLESTVAVAVRTLAPSLLDTDILKVAIPS